MSADTARKSRNRDSVLDMSHTANCLQSALNAAQGELAILLQSSLLLPLDDLLGVVREFIEPLMTRSAPQRLQRRRDRSRLPKPAAPSLATKPFKDYADGSDRSVTIPRSVVTIG